MKNDDLQINKLLNVLMISWSSSSSLKWTKENPSSGQCAVTALVVNDIFNGEILKTKINDEYHFYNRINGRRYDFTESQFEETPVYMDILSNREEALANIDIEQYNYLKAKVFAHLNL